mmetsp:Transcript_38529/g.99715  ORF Transcript_38529/g.99715 Transcript_38529/m.99715 type:complete len:240 (-) Transcript_38529:76-795(-)
MNAFVRRLLADPVMFNRTVQKSPTSQATLAHSAHSGALCACQHTACILVVLVQRDVKRPSNKVKELLLQPIELARGDADYLPVVAVRPTRVVVKLCRAHDACRDQPVDVQVADLKVRALGQESVDIDQAEHEATVGAKIILGDAHQVVLDVDVRRLRAVECHQATRGSAAGCPAAQLARHGREEAPSIGDVLELQILLAASTFSIRAHLSIVHAGGLGSVDFNTVGCGGCMRQNEHRQC